jgi:hypothetical protein
MPATDVLSLAQSEPVLRYSDSFSSDDNPYGLRPTD